MLTAGASGSGKTLITCGVLMALVKRGIRPASFKCGPDYIDPMFHTRVIGTPSRNLDTFFTGEEITRYLLANGPQGQEMPVDVAVMEGVMGYYDGVGGTTTRASAYDLARVTETPSILIVNSRGMSVSLCAYIKGFAEYRADSRIRGVIFNQMSPMLYPRMKDLVEKETGLQVCGYVPKVEDCVIESRHLGLVLPHEIEDLRSRLNKLAEVLEKSVEIDTILSIAQSAPPLTVPQNLESIDPDFGFHTEKPVRIGIASDEAFCFYYADNISLLKKMGAEPVFFSPLHDEHLPDDLQGLILYGGYPELYAEKLAGNIRMKEEIAGAIRQGMPCMAECGGFMYLHEEMEDMDGTFYKTCGIIKGKAFRTARLSRFGYIVLNRKGQEGPFCSADVDRMPAHEFHYFDSESCGSMFHAAKPESARGWDCIHASGTLMAGFPHLYYYGAPALPKAFLSACERYCGLLS